ncbi:hypothetical protein C9J44_08565 [Photobacterium sp. GB-27]|uniref:Uncharacterized protein n=1 Tax=Photobacterium angustum TaxID=661 RepID=A0A2S7VXF9_PHOAN|nr:MULTISPECIES: hypothetical protein [Photobacterium]PQJ66807.1 hypothetical protein BTO08_04910 [Photobacterium angustum]PSV37266.1 hypothetical protein C9J44_08565 [Photobacterium sp. GB-27]
MKLSYLLTCAALFSPLALAESTQSQPQQNVFYILAVTIIFLIALACYRVTKNKARKHKPEIPSFIHHLIGFVIGFICFYALFYFLGFCF